MTSDRRAFQIDGLRADDRGAWEAMTFPAYRHLLALEPAKRLPAEAEQRVVKPVAVTARFDGRAAGLALAEVGVRPADGPPELLSVFVATEFRRLGLGTRLIEAAEQWVRALGGESIEAVYMTGKPSIVAVERIFAARGWEAPALRAVTVKATIQEGVSVPWFGRGSLPGGAEIFDWKDLTVAERRQIVDSNDRNPWIPLSLQPWRHDQIGFEPVSSLGLRYRGEVVGWVINHRVDERTVRFTCSFMRADLSRRARIVPLYTESIRRLSETGCQYLMFITPTVYPPMVEFIRRHLVPYVSFTGETRGTRKVLAAPAADGEMPA